MIRCLRILAVHLAWPLLLGGAAAVPAQAQWFPGFGGIEGRVGAAGVEEARSGFSASVDLDLGSIWWYRLHVLFGGNYLRAVTERTPEGGSFTAVGARAALRLDIVELAAFRPYLLAQVSGHDVNAGGVQNALTRDLLQGFYAGAGVGGGFALDLGARDAAARNRTSAVVEVRRVLTNNVSHWAAEVGLRHQRRVERPTMTDADWLERERRRIAGERDRTLLEMERRRAEEERATEAERRMRDALRGLDRSIPSVSAVRETERGVVVVFGAGMFAGRESVLSPNARADVGRLAAVLQQHPDAMLTVEGHTDATGSEALSQQLSEVRAEAVRAALIAEGMSPERVRALGYGQSRPIASNETASGRAANRRVEVVIAPGGR